MVALTPDIGVRTVRTIPPNGGAVNVGDAKAGRRHGDALDDIGISGSRAAEVAHVVAIHDIKVGGHRAAALAATDGQTGAGNQHEASRTEIPVPAVKKGVIIRGEPA